MSLGRCIIAGILSGTLGAILWGAIVYFTGYEIGWIAWGVGVLVGITIRFASGGADGGALGVAAALIALASIAGGKYFGAYMAVQSTVNEISKQEVTDEQVRVYIADRVVGEMEADGKTLKWPDGMTLEDAETQEDYPPEVWKDMEERWAGMTPAERTDFRAQLKEHYKGTLRSATASIAGIGFMDSFSLWDVLWAFLAVGSAFKIGSGMVSNSEE